MLNLYGGDQEIAGQMLCEILAGEALTCRDLCKSMMHTRPVMAEGHTVLSY